MDKSPLSPQKRKSAESTPEDDVRKQMQRDGVGERSISAFFAKMQAKDLKIKELQAEVEELKRYYEEKNNPEVQRQCFEDILAGRKTIDECVAALGRVQLWLTRMQKDNPPPPVMRKVSSMKSTPEMRTSQKYKHTESTPEWKMSRRHLQKVVDPEVKRQWCKDILAGRNTIDECVAALGQKKNRVTLWLTQMQKECPFTQHTKDGIQLICVYLDDFLIVTHTEAAMKSVIYDVEQHHELHGQGPNRYLLQLHGQGPTRSFPDIEISDISYKVKPACHDGLLLLANSTCCEQKKKPPQPVKRKASSVESTTEKEQKISRRHSQKDVDPEVQRQWCEDILAGRQTIDECVAALGQKKGRVQLWLTRMQKENPPPPVKRKARIGRSSYSLYCIRNCIDLT